MNVKYYHLQLKSIIINIKYYLFERNGSNKIVNVLTSIVL